MRGALLVCGTASDAGKSVVTAGICRWLARAGVRVAPFKAQNMALNAAVTADGGEVGPAELVAAVTGHAAPTAVSPPNPTEASELDVKDAEKRQALWWYLLLTGLLLLAVETVVSNRLSQGERFL